MGGVCGGRLHGAGDVVARGRGRGRARLQVILRMKEACQAGEGGGATHIADVFTGGTQDGALVSSATGRGEIKVQLSRGRKAV